MGLCKGLKKISGRNPGSHERGNSFSQEVKGFKPDNSFESFEKRKHVAGGEPYEEYLKKSKEYAQEAAKIDEEIAGLRREKGDEELIEKLKKEQEELIEKQREILERAKHAREEELKKEE